MALRQSANSSIRAGEPALLNASNDLGDTYAAAASRITTAVVSQSSDRVIRNQCHRSPISTAAEMSSRTMSLNLVNAGGSCPVEAEVKIVQHVTATHAITMRPTAQ